MSNNFDPSKLNIDFSKIEDDNNTSNLQDKDKSLIKEDVLKKTEEEIKREKEIEEEYNKKKLEEEQRLEKEKRLEEVSTILIDPEVRPEELKEKDKKRDENINEDWTKKEVIFNINVKTLEDLIKTLLEKKYDFVLANPNSEYVRIEFKKQWVIKDAYNIRYKEYTSIFIKAKNTAKLNIEDSENEQKWEWIIPLWQKEYKLMIKTVPSNWWEKLYIKILTEQKRQIKKENKKVSTLKAFTYLWVLLFIALVVWWIFLTFLIMNAKTIDDIRFFYSMWINLNDINAFLLKLVWFIFSILLFIEVIFLSVNIFKAMLTKKEYKQQKTVKILLSIFFWILTFTSASAWMYLDKTIRSFPNWQEMAYWDVQIYDNSILISNKFNTASSLLENTKDLIWPITIKFDLTYAIKSLETKWFIVDKYLWQIDDVKLERLTPELIYDFNKVNNYNLSLTLIWKDWTEKPFESIPKNVDVSYLVNVEENLLTNWWKTVQFDASWLRQLWDIEWYDESDLENPKYVWEYFKPSTIYFEDTLIWMHIKREWWDSWQMDKIFVIKSNTWDGLKWEIEAIQDIDNDLKFKLTIKNPETDFWNGFIETFKWIIDWKTITKQADLTKLEESSEVEHLFEEYWDKEIAVQLIDSAWKIKEIKKTIKIPKRLRLKSQLEISEDNRIFIEKEDFIFDKNTSEYFVYWVWTPTQLRFNAKKVKPDTFLYQLDEVIWDIDNDWDIDKKWSNVVFDFPTEADYVIWVTYKFTHRRDKWVTVEKQEVLNIKWIKKEAILDLKIDKDNDYVPVVVSFDASKSYVKNKNIVKFIYDYGDWTPPEERDALNLWHKYISAWDYNVKLTVVTEDGSQYSTIKKIILKPMPESAIIDVSMKTWYVWSGIDFSSAKSEWQIRSYLWDFWDWEISTKANPSHEFMKPWTYKVKLELEFENRNVMTDEIEIKIQ